MSGVWVGRTDGKALQVSSIEVAEQILALVGVMDPAGLDRGDYFIDHEEPLRDGITRAFGDRAVRAAISNMTFGGSDDEEPRDGPDEHEQEKRSGVLIGDFREGVPYVLIIDWDHEGADVHGPFETIGEAQVYAEDYREARGLPREATGENNDIWTDAGWYFAIRQPRREA